MPEDRYVYLVREIYGDKAELKKAKLLKETAKMVIIEKTHFKIWQDFGYRTHIPKDEVFFSPFEAAQARATFLKDREDEAQQRYQQLTRQRKSAEALAKRYAEVARVVEPGEG